MLTSSHTEHYIEHQTTKRSFQYKGCIYSFGNTSHWIYALVFVYLSTSGSYGGVPDILCP